MEAIAALDALIEHFNALPGIGKKTAMRLAYHILEMDAERAKSLARAIITAKEKIGLCRVCFNISDTDPCRICSSTRRDRSTVCVVEKPRDVAAVERMHNYRGLYHVLHGALSPLNGVGPNDIRFKELVARMGDGEIKEVIVATNPNVEGEATAMYAARLLKPLGVKVTRIASGLPIGGDMELADEVTVAKAIENRREI